MKDDFRADLHCHSTCSDGSLTPRELIDLALVKGLSGLSITDHDTVSAYADAIPYAKEKGLFLLPGAELSSVCDGKSVHILAYGYNPESDIITKFCAGQSEQRLCRFYKIVEKAKTFGIFFEDEGDPLSRYILATSSPGRPHIAQLLIKKGLVKDVGEAFKIYLSEGRPLYVPLELPSVKEVIEVIRQAQGVSILAHPHLIKDTKFIQRLLAFNFDGIEAYYARMPPNENSRWVRSAKKKGLMITGGSDFHGAAKTYIDLGCSWVDKEIFMGLYEKK